MNRVVKVLIIESNTEIRTWLVNICQSVGWHTLTADNGNQGLKLALQKLPDVVIANIWLPQLDGYNLLSKLQADQSGSNITVILYSGAAEPRYWRRAMKLGADDFLIMPTSPCEVQGTIQARLDKKNQQQQQLQQKLQHLNNYISKYLPHEVRTAVTGILTSSSFLHSELDSLNLSIVKDMLNGLTLSAKRLSRLTENFLLHSRLELRKQTTGQLNSTSAAAAVQTLPYEATKVLSSQAQKVAHAAGRSDDLVVELTDATVAIDRQSLGKIIEELVDNAMKFSASGTPVVLRSQVRLNYLTITISDAGRGMSAAQIAQIGPYVQFERQKYEQQGSGLGLAIAKNLLHLHGGKLVIKSILGEGTLVKVSIPLAASPAPQWSGSWIRL